MVSSMKVGMGTTFNKLPNLPLNSFHLASFFLISYLHATYSNFNMACSLKKVDE
jgi:hypothetical protein